MPALLNDSPFYEEESTSSKNIISQKSNLSTDSSKKSENLEDKVKDGKGLSKIISKKQKPISRERKKSTSLKMLGLRWTLTRMQILGIMISTKQQEA